MNLLPPCRKLFAVRAVVGGRVVNNVLISFNAEGCIESIESDANDPTSACDGDVGVTGTGDGNTVVRAEWALPGFVDIHNHGISGSSDVLEYWLDPSANCQDLCRLGTTSCLATLTFPKDNPAVVQRTVSAIAEFIETQIDPCSTQHGGRGESDKREATEGASNFRSSLWLHGAILEGIHAEGPVVADFGGLATSDVDMSLSDFRILVDSMLPWLKLMTISPSKEALCGYERMRYLMEHGVKPCLGHDTKATLEEIVGALRCHADAVAQGQCSKGDRLHITHCFNVSKFHHRLPGLVNIGLLRNLPPNAEYQGLQPPTIEIIGDNVHVHPLTLQLALQCRPPSDIAFISDACAAPPSHSRNGTKESDQEGITYVGRNMVVDEMKNGLCCCVLEGTNTLAGSCSTPHQIFTHLLALGVDIVDATTMLTKTPATIANLKNVGEIRVGYRGNIVCTDKEWNIQRVWINGQICDDGR